MRSITSFVCQECGYESPQWLGKCPECGVWNSLKEFKVQSSKFKVQPQRENIKPKTLAEIRYDSKDRISTGFSEFDSVLGGGVVKGSVILLAGDPGIGKSTLLLQLALNHTQKVLYISGEESQEQIKMRAKRIHNDIERVSVLVLSTTSTETAISAIEKTKPSFVVVDSIQTMESENVAGLAGSIPQVRYAASQFIRTAKTLNIPIIIVGHVTKEGMVAGPMILSHMVDSVLFLEGEKFTRTRILRSLKNRFGSLDEVGIFSIGEKGIKEVRDTKDLFASLSDERQAFGNILVVTLEGTRAFLVEIQGLVVSSNLPVPRRVALGVDYKRLELLLAVLQKHCGLPFGTMDIFVNVAGGLKLSDPAADLGICLAVFSSFRNISLSDTVAISEVGLLGELRPVQFIEKRIKEAKKLGFKNIISHNTYKTLNEVIKSLK